MRNRFNGSRRGRRPASFGSVPGGSSPYDFTSQDEDSPDPIDFLSIRADDEMLDALASGLSSFGGSDGRHALGADHGLDDNINDDRQMLALLAVWRDEVRNEPIPELISVEDASEAIVAGHRTEHPRRRLMSVAAAAAVVVLGMSGVALSAGSAKPGDTLWGVSKALNGDRATSVEAAQEVGVTLASVRQALAEGHVAEAQAKLATITPVLSKVTDEQTKTELADTQANLAQTVQTAKEGEKVKTDDSGKRDDDHDSGRGSDPDRGSNGHNPRPDGSNPGSGTDQPDPYDPRFQIQKSTDPRFSPGKPGDSKPEPSTAPDSAGAGPERHGPGTGPGTTTSQPDPRRTGGSTTPTTTEQPKPTTKPTSGRPSRGNPPPRKTTAPNNGGGTGGGNSGGGADNGGAGPQGQDNAGGQNKPDGQRKGEGEGAPVQVAPPAQLGPVPPGS